MYNHWGEALLLLFCFVPFRLFLTYNPTYGSFCVVE